MTAVGLKKNSIQNERPIDSLLYLLFFADSCSLMGSPYRGKIRICDIRAFCSLTEISTNFLADLTVRYRDLIVGNKAFFM